MILPKKGNYFVHTSSASGVLPVVNNSVIPHRMRNLSAFTLIELLVVVLIIGILAAVAVPQYQRAVDKSKFTQLVTVSKQIVDAQQAYYMANGVYAMRADELTLDLPLLNNGAQFGTSTWHCEFTYANGAGGSPRTSCYMNQLGIGFQRLHERNNVNCCAYASSNWKGDWLCQDITQKKTPYSNQSSMRCYSGDI